MDRQKEGDSKSMEDEKNSVKVEEKGSLETESDQKLHKEDDKFQRLGGPEEIKMIFKSRSRCTSEKQEREAKVVGIERISEDYPFYRSHRYNGPKSVTFLPGSFTRKRQIRQNTATFLNSDREMRSYSGRQFGKEFIIPAPVNFSYEERKEVYRSGLSDYGEDLDVEDEFMDCNVEFEDENERPRALPRHLVPIHNSTHPNSIFSRPFIHPDLKQLRAMRAKAIAINRRNRQQNLQTKEGYLLKMAATSMVGWQKKYCLLENKAFRYYKNKNTKILGGILDFDWINASIQVEKPKKNKHPTKFKIIVVGSCREFKFKSSTFEELKEWVFNIERHIMGSRGKFENMTKMSIQQKFWKNKHIKESDFKYCVETGDLLLFKSKAFLAKCQRGITGSSYDHVAVFLRFQDDTVVVFEVTASSGVAMYLWEDFVRNKWHFQYFKMVFRHLKFTRQTNMIIDLEKYIKRVVGKPYKFSLWKLMRKQKQGEKDKSYFCSELVARVYKIMGILPADVPSSQYFPGSFSTEKELPLQKGAQLGEEMVIDFLL